MANRRFYQFHGALEPGIVALYLEVAIGATGAPTLTYGKGVTSIARTTNGEYLITLADKYNRLLAFNPIMESTTGEDITFQVDASAVASGTVAFFTNTADTPTDPTSGDKIYIELKLKNSTV